MKKEYLEAGKFGAPHGVKGDIKAENWCDDIGVLKELKTVYLLVRDTYRALTVERCVPYKDGALLHIAGYENPEETSVLKNKVFYAKREDLPLPEGSFFIADLIGLSLYDADDGHVYGVLKDIINGAASQLYEVETVSGKTAYMPVVPQFVIEIDFEKGIAVRPVKGLFDEN